MAFDELTPYLTIATLCFVAAGWTFSRREKRTYCRIPGPRGLPFLGSLDLPRERHWETYGNLSEEYGQ